MKVRHGRFQNSRVFGRLSRTPLVFVTLLLASGALACDNSNSSDIGGSYTPISSSTINSPIPTVTPEARTGVSVLDEIISSVLHGDAEHVANLLQFQTLGCVTLEQVSSPPLCKAGEAPGTIVEAFPIGKCEGVHVRRDVLVPQLAGLVDSAENVYTAYRSRPDSQGREQFSVVFTIRGTNRPQGFTVYVTGGKITFIGGPCGVLRAQDFEAVAEEFFIPPL